MTFNAPVPPPTYNVTPSSLADESALLIHTLDDFLALMSDCPESEATYNSVIVPWSNIENLLGHRLQVFAGLAGLHPSQEIREAATKALTAVDEPFAGMNRYVHLYRLCNAVYQSHECGDLQLDAEGAKDLRKKLEGFRWAGCHLSEKDRDRLGEITNQVLKLKRDFETNIGKDPGAVWKTEAELAGVAPAKMEGFEKDDLGRRRVTLKTPDYTTVLTQCSVRETRKEVFLEFNSSHPENSPLFIDKLRLRTESSHLLGFKSFSERCLSQKLIGSLEAAEELLAELSTKLRPVVQRDIQVMQDYSGLAEPLALWDARFYETKILKERYSVDQELVSEYFSAELTLRRMLDIFKELFALKFVSLDAKPEQVWHETVTLFEVWDVSQGDEPQFLAYLYMDIYVRDGKYNHAANFNINPGYSAPDGSRMYPATALVANVAKFSATEPALLRHANVLTIFHELGHCIHDILGHSRYERFHGHRAIWDFVEAPSQLLEFWCWEPSVLRRMSHHYSHLSPEYEAHWRRHNKGTASLPPEEVPIELCEALVAAKNFNQGYKMARQLAFSLFDLKVYGVTSQEEIDRLDPGTLYNELSVETTRLDGPPAGVEKWCHSHVTTNHHMSSNESTYYAYLYTQTIATDIWYELFRDDPMSKATAAIYRKKILEKGGTGDEAAMLVDLLGRPPRLDHFLRNLESSNP